MADAREEDSLVEETAEMSSYPAYRPKQIVFGILALLAVAFMFLPWWISEIPLNRIAPTLNGWQLFLTGLGLTQFDDAAGYSWSGTVLFGLLPTLPTLALVVVLALRLAGVGSVSARLVQLYGIFATLGIVWLFLFGALRLDSANGQYPPGVGAWLALLPTVAATVVASIWWRRERIHFPTRRWLGLGPVVAEKRVEAADASMFDDLVQPDDDEQIELGPESGFDENTEPGRLWKPKA